MKVIRPILGIILAALALASTRAEAAVVQVSAASTSAIEDGSAANPFRSIQAGLNAAVSGDDVVVAPGIYYGAIELKSNVRLVSEQGPKVTIVDALGAGSAVVMPYDPSPVTSMDGFTIRGADIGVYVTNRNNFWSSSRFALSNSIVRDVRVGIEGYPMSSVTVTRSLFTHVTTVIDQIWCGVSTFTNVTIDQVAGSAFIWYQTGSLLTNTSLSNAQAAFATWGYSGSGWVGGSNNDLFNISTLLVGGWSGRVPGVSLSGTLEADPLFVDAGAADYTLAAGSPLIDAGLDVGLPYVGAAPDIGAYERGPATPVEALQALAESYQATPLPAFKNAGEQRRHALQNKLAALLKKLASVTPEMTPQAQLGVYGAALNELLNDIWAKADGFYGGNPANDWITTKAEQDALYPKVVELRDLIQAEIAKLQAP